MRTTSDDTVQTTPATKKKVQPPLQTFSVTISDGREITIREMTGRDLVYLEKDLAKEGEISKGMKIIERLVVSEDKITYEEILDLGIRDFRKLSELVSKANGGDEDESPN